MRMVAKKIEKSPGNCACNKNHVFHHHAASVEDFKLFWIFSPGSGAATALSTHHPSLTYLETHFTSKYCFRVANKGPGLLNREGVVRMRRSGKRQASPSERWTGVC